MTSKSQNLPDSDGAADRRMRAQIAANTRWAFEPNRSAATAPARRGLDEKFLKLVDPDGVLDPAERALRAEALRRAHFLRMAHKSAKVRREKNAGRQIPWGAMPPSSPKDFAADDPAGGDAA